MVVKKSKAAKEDTASETVVTQAVVSTLGEVRAEVNRKTVVEELGNGTVKETF